ncbi:septum formation initiator family protein [Myxococcota bacterium]|nr:septum formation initiator family protein [Myxococcota bacterium]
MKWVLRIFQTMVVLAVLALMGIVVASDYLGPARDQLEQVENQRDLLRMQAAAREREKQRLEQELEGLRRNPQVLEHGIREDLGYVRPDEKVLELPEGTKRTSDGSPSPQARRPGR